MRDDKTLLEDAKNVLKQNDRGSYTMPAGELYPHQWLWDSCFTAIGLRHVDVERAKEELLSLLRGQWSNGMLPNMIFSDDPAFRRDRGSWKSWLNPASPDGVATSGITQPPMLAEAVVRIGEKLALPERRAWYQQMWDGLVAYHQWLYTDRDPHEEGLISLVHPWETGLDNTPPWMDYLQEHQLPLWIRILHATKLENLVGLFRRDTRSVPLNERFTNHEILALYDVQLRLRRKAYNIDRILDHSLFAIEDLGFNSIFIRANKHLRDIAKLIGEDLPEGLAERMAKTEKEFDQLWDELTSQYYSRDFVTHKWLRESSVATLLPLYAGHISKERATELIRLIESPHQFGLSFPLPSVPRSSAFFDPQRYWQGPTWININWLVIDGLKRYGFHEHAEVLKEVTLELVAKNGCYEYFDPLDGSAHGSPQFSWTAALAIDLLKSK
jgi:glycogen debranching enzyme